MKNTNTPKMKWYNFLVYFWLPMDIFLDLISVVLVGRMCDPVMGTLLSPNYEISPSKGVNLFYLVLLLFVYYLFPLIYTIIVRRSLKKFKYNAPKLLTLWYIMPILMNVLACQILFQVGAALFFGVIFLGTLRAAIMIPINKAYFSKRADLFEDNSEEDLEK